MAELYLLISMHISYLPMKPKDAHTWALPLRWVRARRRGMARADSQTVLSTGALMEATRSRLARNLSSGSPAGSGCLPHSSGSAVTLCLGSSTWLFCIPCSAGGGSACWVLMLVLLSIQAKCS